MSRGAGAGAGGPRSPAGERGAPGPGRGSRRSGSGGRVTLLRRAVASGDAVGAAAEFHREGDAQVPLPVALSVGRFLPFGGSPRKGHLRFEELRGRRETVEKSAAAGTGCRRGQADGGDRLPARSHGARRAAGPRLGAEPVPGPADPRDLAWASGSDSWYLFSIFTLLSSLVRGELFALVEHKDQDP